MASKWLIRHESCQQSAADVLEHACMQGVLGARWVLWRRCQPSTLVSGQCGVLFSQTTVQNRCSQTLSDSIGLSLPFVAVSLDAPKPNDVAKARKTLQAVVEGLLTSKQKTMARWERSPAFNHPNPSWESVVAELSEGNGSSTLTFSWTKKAEKLFTL